MVKSSAALDNWEFSPQGAFMLCKIVLTFVLQDYTILAKKQETVMLAKETTESKLSESCLKYNK